MNAPKLGVMYKTWQHNFRHGIQKFMHKVGRDNPVKNMFFDGLARTLGGCTFECDGKICKKEGS